MLIRRVTVSRSYLDAVSLRFCQPTRLLFLHSVLFSTPSPTGLLLRLEGAFEIDDGLRVTLLEVSHPPSPLLETVLRIRSLWLTAVPPLSSPMPATNRVHLPMFIYLELLTLFSSLVAGLGARSSSDCRCLSGDPCWPNATEFSRLQGRLSQPLLYPLPPASPCYALSGPSGDCDQVHRQWTNASFRATLPGAMQASNFETFVSKNGTISACYNNTSLGVSCEQGSVPVVGVDARSDADIQAAVQFAAAHNLRLVVKSTG